MDANIQNQRPSIETSVNQQSTLAAYNDFIIRLEALKHRSERPFKSSFVEFIHRLVLRMPVAPEIAPLTNGAVRFRYRKPHSPKDKWQTLEIVIYPKRAFDLKAESRFPSVDPVTRTNIARPDIIADAVRNFYELDSVNVVEHPLRYRQANINDQPYIAAMCQLTFGPHIIYKPLNIKKLMEYCTVAEDPTYGIVSVAALSETLVDGFDYELTMLITIENYRGLSMASKCLRKAVADCLTEHPDARILAKSILRDGEDKDVCQSPLTRAGFRQIKIVKGEKRFRGFDCDRCNTTNCWCDFANPNSCCSTVYYQLKDRGGKKGYSGRKPTK